MDGIIRHKYQFPFWTPNQLTDTLPSLETGRVSLIFVRASLWLLCHMLKKKEAFFFKYFSFTFYIHIYVSIVVHV